MKVKEDGQRKTASISVEIGSPAFFPANPPGRDNFGHHRPKAGTGCLFGIRTSVVCRRTGHDPKVRLNFGSITGKNFAESLPEFLHFSIQFIIMHAFKFGAL